MYLIPKLIKWLKANPVRLFVGVLHALWLLALTFFWLSQSYTYGDEFFLVQITSGIRHIVLKPAVRPSSPTAHPAFVFVSVSYDKELIPKLDPDGFEIGNQEITDREKLARFFQILNQRPDAYQFVLCDIFFKDDSPHDPLLETELNQMKNILIPYHQSTSGQWAFPKFSSVKMGLADYIAADTKGTFLKFRLTEQGHKTIPLLMYEKLHHAEFRKTPWGYAMNGRYSLSSVVLDFKIRRHDLFQGEAGCPSVYLGEMLRHFPDEEILELVRDRIIVMGDFDVHDIHETVFGDMPGPLILVNAYLSLVNGDNHISLSFLIVLFFVYLLISDNMFYGTKIEERQWTIRIIRSVIRGRFIAKLLNYLLVMSLVSVLSYFFFNIHINILFIAAYLTVLGDAVRYVREKGEPSDISKGV